MSQFWGGETYFLLLVFNIWAGQLYKMGNIMGLWTTSGVSLSQPTIKLLTPIQLQSGVSGLFWLGSRSYLRSRIEIGVVWVGTAIALETSPFLPEL